MAKISLNHKDALHVRASCDLIFTDPPFDMPAPALNSILNTVQCDQLVLITTMKQLIDLLKISDWQLNFDFVLDAVVPKKSKSIHQPNYTHSTGAYLTRNKAKSLFNRKLRQRSDTFDNNGYWPTVLRAPRQNMQEHGMAKNERAMIDILGSFDVKKIYDPFAGNGTTGMAAFQLDMDCELTELNDETFNNLEKKFKFITG